MHDRSAVAVSAVEAVDEPAAVAALARFATQLDGCGVLPLHLGALDGDGWVPLPVASEDLRRWHRSVAEGRDGVAAAALLAGRIAAAPALVIGLPALFARVVPRVELDGLAVRRDGGGVVTGYALTAPAAHGGAGADVLDAAADSIVRLTAPLVADLRAALPVGRAATWGATTDAIASYALWFARRTGVDEPAVWDRADRLIGRVSDAIGIRTRPRLFPVTWSGGTSHFPVRGTCCLYHRTCGGEVRGEDRYCVTCPLRSDDGRSTCLVAHLEGSS